VIFGGPDGSGRDFAAGRAGSFAARGKNPGGPGKFTGNGAEEYPGL